MSERPVNVTTKGVVIEDELILFVGGKIYQGWEDVKVTRQVNVLASTFDVQLTDRWAEGQETWDIKPGQAVHIHLGKSSILTGYVDDVKASISAQDRSITISGRSKTGDLVDCSVEGPAEYDGLTLKEIAVKVCEPFGVKVVFLTDPGAAFGKITLQNGETALALLERLSRQRKVLLYPSYEGSLIFTTQGAASVPTSLVLGVNILSANVSHSHADRFSKYLIKGQSAGFLGEDTTPDEDETAISPSGEATDDAITRYRPLIVMAESTVDTGSTEDRATYEATLRAAKSLTAEVEVQGWYSSGVTPWEINSLVYLDAGAIGLRRKMLIDKVTFNKSNGGTRTSLSLVQQDAYNFKTKKKKKEADLSWAKDL